MGFRIITLLIFFLLVSQLNFSQNLVPNPSFEIVSSCPNNYNQVSRATGWFPSSNNNNPTYHTDYCNACGTSLFQVPANTWGNQAAPTGVGYMAAVTMDPGSQPNYRENIYAQLTSPLVIGNTYFVSLKVSHTDNSKYASNNFGAKFSTVPDFPINNICQVYSANIISDKQNWVTISGCFVADSAYKYICLGNFFTDANTLTQQSCPGCQWPLYGYYVDDVSVTLFTSNIACSGTTSLCAGQTTTLTASGGVNYSWSTGATTSSIVVSPIISATYSVNISNGTCSADTSITINVSPNSLYLDMAPDRNICLGQSTTLSCGVNTTSYTWSPSNGLSNPYAANPSATPTVTTSYTVVAANAAGCTATGSMTVYVLPVPPTPTITSSGNVLASSVSTGNQWYMNGNIITGETGQFYTATQSGFYQVVVTNASGCTAMSNLLNYTFTGILENIPEVSFSIYPNPNDGDFSLEINAVKNEEMSIFIVNEIGQVVYREKKVKLNGQLSKKIYLKNIHNGIYSIRIQTAGGCEVKKFIVQ